jgi:hypothetical protein
VRYPFRLRKGRFSAADLLNEEIINDVIENGGLEKEKRIQLKSLLKSHFIYFLSQKKGAVLKELLQGKKTSASFSSKEKREMTASNNSDVARYIRSFS